jgi:hypothetical protein
MKLKFEENRDFAVFPLTSQETDQINNRVMEIVQEFASNNLAIELFEELEYYNLILDRSIKAQTEKLKELVPKEIGDLYVAELNKIRDETNKEFTNLLNSVKPKTETYH